MALLTRSRLMLAFLVTACFALAQDAALQGRVVDMENRPVPGAKVTILRSDTTTSTDDNGGFTFGSLTVPSSELEITAPGFAPLRFPWHAGERAQVWQLEVARLEQRVTVHSDASSRTLYEIDRSELTNHAAPDLDSILRQVPGFTLFRRTPSWSANPTTQGVSLRGAGASGASRALVVMNGIPLNEPFGGWVYWGRVSPEMLDEAVVVQGGTSDLYGSQAMGGVVELNQVQPTEQHLTGMGYGGDLGTAGGSFTTDFKAGRWWSGIDVSGFRTNGYVPVPADQRGLIDTVANSENGSGWLRVDRDFGDGARVFVAGNLYGESRQNGTQLQFNSATVRELRTGGDWSGIGGGQLSARVYGGTESLRQTFSAIAIDRASESLTRDQSVPAARWGTSALWARNIGRNSLVFGSDSGWSEGDSEEWAYATGIRSAHVLSGGSQWRVAGFAQDRLQLGSRTSVSAGIRVDHWVNQDGRSRTEALLPSTVPSHTSFVGSSETFVSPRLGIDHSVSSRVIVHAAVSRAFREPTLNELYRSFRVGSILTLANAQLASERQTGVEAGANFRVTQGNSVRAAYFWNSIQDPIANFTLSITPTLITRQRTNLGSLRSSGVDLWWESRWTGAFTTTFAYQFANAFVHRFGADPALEGLWVPQVAHNNASVQLRYSRDGKFTAALGGRYQGLQFDDDRNQLPLGGYFIADLYISKQIRPSLAVFAGAENALNRRYEVGRTPVTSVGPPVLARIGIRFTIPSR